MPDVSYLDVLSEYGDDIERRGINECGLGISFPRYAEFWSKYVFPNRDKDDSSKLRRGIKPELEDIFNNHYGVYCHLTFAISQIDSLPSPVVDIGTPLYHLGTSIDLAEKTLFAALLVKNGNGIVRALHHRDFEDITQKFWKNQYEGAFNQFVAKSIPVSLTLHRIRKIVELGVPDWKKVDESRNIQNYRNALTHDLFPLRMIDGEEVLIPKPEYLEKYRGIRWSSDRDSLDNNHYAPAKVIIRDLAFGLVNDLNAVWSSLLHLMNEIESMIDFQVVKGFEALSMARTAHASGYVYTEGSPGSADIRTHTRQSRLPSDGDPLS